MENHELGTHKHTLGQEPMRATEFITEATQTSLEQLYKGQYPDDDELFWEYVSPNDFDKPLSIQVLPKYKIAMMLLGQYRVEHLDDLTDMLNDDQQEVVQSYMADPNLSHKVIVTYDGRIVDGNHRALAAALKGSSIMCVDLSEIDEDHDEPTNEARVISGTTLVDVYIRGNHKGKVFTKLVVKDFPHNKVPALTKELVDRYNVNPSAIVYGPSKGYDRDLEIVDEAPLPPDWDEKQYAPGTTFKARLAYALERAKKLGTGSSRVATTIEYQGRPTVLKIAKNQKGLAQNSVEASVLSDGLASDMKILIPIIDYDTQNREPTWIHTEMAEKATEKQLCSIMKCRDLFELVNMAYAILGRRNYGRAEDIIAYKVKNGASDSDIAAFKYYAHKLAELSANYDVQLGDFTRKANWGMYKGRPVVIDVGFNTTVMNMYYSRF